MTRARCTNLIGSLRDFASRLISCSSSFVKVRNMIRLGMLSSCFRRTILIYFTRKPINSQALIF
jgi:hypothetical protein